jgi:hypothetical protein
MIENFASLLRINRFRVVVYLLGWIVMRTQRGTILVRIMQTILRMLALRLPFTTDDIIRLGDRVRTKNLPSFWIYFWISLFLCLVGWGGLFYLINETLPFLGPRWLFFFFLMLAVTGLVLPVTYFLNRRFPSDPPADSGVVLREAMWAGVYACALVWLQLGRVLNPGLMVVLAAGMLLVEFLLRLRERTVWTPQPADGPGEEQDEEDDEFDDD